MSNTSNTTKTPAPEAGRNDKDFITVAELLKRVPISRRCLWLWRKKGRIPAIKLPGCKKVLFHWPTVVAALQRYQETKG
jgi:predicted site-specific integrase-resolvase